VVQCGKNSTVKKRDLGNKSVNVMVFFQNLHFGLAGRGQNLTEGQQNKCYHCAEKKFGVGGGLRLFFPKF
jgi:hypothetical protein